MRFLNTRCIIFKAKKQMRTSLKAKLQNQTKKNRIILTKKPLELPKVQYRTALNGVLFQDKDLKTETKPFDHVYCHQGKTKLPKMIYPSRVKRAQRASRSEEVEIS